MEQSDFGSPSAASLGGKARAKAMSNEDRRESARRAAEARWAKEGKQPLPRATHEGPLTLGEMQMECAVLDNGLRVISESAFSRGLNVVRGGYQYRIRNRDGEGDLPIYLAFPPLKPFISQELRARVSKPIWYIPTTTGQPARGVDATMIPEVCNVWVEASHGGALSARGIKTAKLASTLMRGLATVGIVALVDEATGFQDERDRRALAKILEAFVAKELRPWVHTFPVDYYREMYRLKGKPYNPQGNRMPRYFGLLTNDIVYARLAPGVLDELKRVTPRYENGRLKHHLHRRLTDNVGHPKLLQHLGAVVALMKISPENGWDEFIKLLNRAYPRQTPAPLFDQQASSAAPD